MIKPKGLGRQITVFMGLGAVMGVLACYLGFYLFFIVITFVFPDAAPPDDSWLPTGMEMISLALIGIVALSGAIILAALLAKRIVTPLNSVARAARQIAGGELSARAEPVARSRDETTSLVDDFNAMAARLEKSAADIVIWNAQIAHELRTPLTVLHGRLQGLIDGVFEPSEPLFRRLLGQVDGLSRLVEDLRVVSLVGSGHLELEFAEVDLAAEIEDFLELVKPSLDRGGFTLTTALAPGVSKIDMTRVRQAMLALIENVVQHATPGDLRIELTLEPRFLEIRVVDSGPGMPTDFANNAFELFSRAQRTGSTKRGGSGLGLSVVQAIARAHGGDVRHRPRGSGSEFIIRLPREGSRLPNSVDPK